MHRVARSGRAGGPPGVFEGCLRVVEDYSEGLRPHAVDPIYHPRVERSCAECVPRGAFQGDAPKVRRGMDGARGRVTVSAVRAPPDCAVGKWSYLGLSETICAYLGLTGPI